MSQVDNRNSSAAKRARTDGGRREDDWTCPSCGNVNFSFRTTCNMRNCTQPRPADHSFKSAPKPLQTPQGYASAASYGSPSSMYVGLPPYGSSLLNGSTVPPYDVGSAYRYNYGTHVSGGSPYRPLQIPASPPYSGGSLIGGMYGVPQLMNRYGLGLPMGPTAMAPRPGFFLEEKGRNKDGKGDNDWICPNCGNNNFSFRTVCNMRKCNTPKTGSQAGSASKSFKPDMPDGSWKCEQCNNINYPFRTKCNRQNCGAEKPSDSQKAPSEEAPEENAQDMFEKVQSRPAVGLKVGRSCCGRRVAAVVELLSYGLCCQFVFSLVSLYCTINIHLVISSQCLVLEPYILKFSTFYPEVLNF
ncbi:putative Zinc finger, RanBP2-type [Helianthus annuus]|uniref:Zinc finger, RanBP2-type n=2 Tax=Helianthus annuus TaxID=4232 RepID=A0A9K3HH42_HELAN|nr:putative Zinc finger, RanBP2-type [Helianthus annuus]KAJ0678568.1 putative Zinc finger, RanBP2-type [Helianthus annuus]KAJ0863014.1 putative Zinc finger, RanBP2-type [Helianthus annuus]